MNMKYNDLGYGLDVTGLGITDTLASSDAATIYTSQSFLLTAVDSIKFIANVQATLASGATLSASVGYQISADNSNWDAAVTPTASAVILTGASGGSTVYTALELDLDTMNKKKYIKFIVTPDFSATSTDVATISGVVVSQPKYND